MIPVEKEEGMQKSHAVKSPLLTKIYPEVPADFSFSARQPPRWGVSTESQQLTRISLAETATEWQNWVNFPLVLLQRQYQAQQGRIAIPVCWGHWQFDLLSREEPMWWSCLKNTPRVQLSWQSCSWRQWLCPGSMVPPNTPDPNSWAPAAQHCLSLCRQHHSCLQKKSLQKLFTHWWLKAVRISINCSLVEAHRHLKVTGGIIQNN